MRFIVCVLLGLITSLYAYNCVILRQQIRLLTDCVKDKGRLLQTARMENKTLKQDIVQMCKTIAVLKKMKDDATRQARATTTKTTTYTQKDMYCK